MSFVRRSSVVCVLGLMALLAACGPNVPAAVQTALPTLPASLATTVPAVVATNAPGVIATAANIPAAIGTAAANTLTVQINAESNSGETGAAVLTEIGGKTTVVLAITGEPAGASQPLHIHEGSCGPTLGKVVFPLTPLANGVSSTTVDTTIANLKSGKFAINGHKSAAEMSTYVFCGNIPQ